MIELQKKGTEQRQLFKHIVAEKLLSDSILRISRGQSGWILPLDSEYIFKDGAIVLKAKKVNKPKKAEVSSNETIVG